VSYAPNPEINIGTTTRQEYGSAPVITSIYSSNPNGFTLGDSATMTILGHNFTAGGQDKNPQVVVASGSGITLGGVTLIDEAVTAATATWKSAIV